MFNQEAIQKASIVLIVTDYKLLIIYPPLVLKKYILQTSIYNQYNYTNEQYYNLRNINTILIDTFRPTLQRQPPQDNPILSAPLVKPLKVDLFEINIVVYNLLCKQKGYTAFIMTLDKISSLISNRLAPEPKAPGLNTLIQALDYNTNE